jgi:hypothetical protein
MRMITRRGASTRVLERLVLPLGHALQLITLSVIVEIVALDTSAP